MIAQTLIDRFEQFASPQIAEPGDPIGLQLGDPNREVKAVMTTLDVRLKWWKKQLKSELILFLPITQ